MAESTAASPRAAEPDFTRIDPDEFLSRPTAALSESLLRVNGPILVLGAGGKMGLHLSAMAQRALRSAGSAQPVIAVSRFSTLRDRGAFAAHGVETIPCDLEDEEALAALPEAEVVYFLAGAKFGTSGDPDRLRRINVDVPRKVGKRYRGSRIVAFSTGCVYPFVTPESGGAVENTAVDSAPAAYAASCIEREQAFEDMARRYQTPVSLIRLNYSVEIRYGVLVDLAMKVMGQEPVDLAMGYLNVIWQSDAVEHALRAWELSRSPAQPLNVTGADVLSVRALAEEFGRLLDCAVSFTGVEAPTAWLNNASFSHCLFGPPPTSVQAMQRWIVAYLRQGGKTWGKPTGFERRDGKF